MFVVPLITCTVPPPVRLDAALRFWSAFPAKVSVAPAVSAKEPLLAPPQIWSVPALTLIAPALLKLVDGKSLVVPAPDLLSVPPARMLIANAAPEPGFGPAKELFCALKTP